MMRVGRFTNGMLPGGIFGCALIFFVTAAFAAPSGVEQIANYKGKDREKVLMEGAKKEGAVSIYSATNAKDSQPLVDGFRKKYPFVKVDLFAGTGESVSARLLMEQKGKKFTADTFNGNIKDVEKVRRGKNQCGCPQRGFSRSGREDDNCRRQYVRGPVPLAGRRTALAEDGSGRIRGADRFRRPGPV